MAIYNLCFLFKKLKFVNAIRENAELPSKNTKMRFCAEDLNKKGLAKR